MIWHGARHSLTIREAPIKSWISMGALAALLSPLVALAADGTVTPPAADGPVPVLVGLYFVEITNIDEMANSFDCEVDVIVEWKDERLAFSPGPDEPAERIYQGPKAENLLEENWGPMITAINSEGATSLKRFTIRITKDGLLVQRARVNARLRAPLDFRTFPFDRQVLPVHLESFQWGSEAVELREIEDRSGFDPAFDLPEWRILDVRTTATSSNRPGEKAPYSRLSFEIDVKRKIGFYVWKAFLPLFIIVTLSWVVFWMSDESLGRRAGVSSTGILTVIAYQFAISSALPRLPYLTLIDKMMLLSVVTIAATMVINVVNAKLSIDRPDSAKRIDRVSRIVFPVGYYGSLLVISIRAGLV